MSDHGGLLDEEDENIDENKEDSVDEDDVADAPISVQVTFGKIFKSRNHYRMQVKNLRTKLKKAHNWCEELRLQIEELNGKLAEKTKPKNCPKCAKFKRQVKARKTELKSLREELAAKEVETQEGDTQTTEEDLRQAAWVYQYNLNLPTKQPNGDGEQSLAEDIREAAEDALIQQGMVLEETSGLYYDYKTGYYYDAEKGLYYDGNSGTYLKYNQETKQYEVDSSLPEEEIIAQKELARRKEEMRRHKVKKRKLSTSSSNSQESTSQSNTVGKSGKTSKSNSSAGQDSKLSNSSDGSTNSKSSVNGAPSSSDKLSVNGAPSSNNINQLSVKEEVQSEDEELLESSIPCIRLCVVQSEDERVQVGSLYIVTCKGGTIGSKGSHEVLLPDLGCSKLHAKFAFHTATCSYTLKDLGSRNGTWVNGKRLSAAKEESKSVVVGHRTMIQIGKTRLCCHVHPGGETCRECEPGLILKEIKTENGVNGGPPKEILRKIELKEMKAKYAIGVGLEEDKKHPANNKLYVDRAQERRHVHGVDPLNAKTETASLDQAISNKNKGFKMLEKMGWVEGGGLGKEKDGIKEPVKVEQRAAQSGLGSSSGNFVLNKTAKEQKKNEIWKKTQKRFTKLPVLDAFKAQESDEEES
eukprot:TRINITY_DN9533_c1_g1_i2.p1 TRINITY_DN9533_c1_g1~~TRINITY_DN9533_c1_g1_i2.p1  ORF type:complete len:650 (-),score=158.06 TRINITY_DN9533_c1_g1_i2:198-2114(-)